MTDLEPGVVSVVIPAYNAEKFVAEAVGSALSQTHRQVDVIVIDDGSTDGTRQAAMDTIGSDGRGRVVSFPNGGLPAARNRGLALARGEFLAQLDADDAWHPTKLERQVEFFVSDPDVVAVGCLMRYMTFEGRRISNRGRFKFTSGLDAGGPDTQEQIRRGLLLPFIPSSAVFRTEILRNEGGSDEDLPGSGEDIDLMARVAEHGRVATVMETLGDYRVHLGSMSTRGHIEYRRLAHFVMLRQEARRSGSDLTLAEFDRAHPTSFLDRRTGYAAFWYRASGVKAVEAKYVAAAGYMALALLAYPEHAISRIRRNLGLWRTKASG